MNGMRQDVALCYLGLISVSLVANYASLPVSFHLIATSLFIIYIGSRNSVVQQRDKSVETEKMETKDAYMFPVIGSVVLCLLYLVFKYDYKVLFNIFVKGYFFCFGLIVLGYRLRAVFLQILSPEVLKFVNMTLCQFRVPTFSYFSTAKPAKDNKTHTDDTADTADTTEETKMDRDHKAKEKLTKKGNKKKKREPKRQRRRQKRRESHEKTERKTEKSRHFVGCVVLCDRHWSRRVVLNTQSLACE